MQITLERAVELLDKHGVCHDCGEMFSHDLEEPIAQCKCKTSEWYTFTPYMQLEQKLKDAHLKGQAKC